MITDNGNNGADNIENNNVDNDNIESSADTNNSDNTNEQAAKIIAAQSRKSKRNLIISAVAAVALLVGIIVLMNISSDKDDVASWQSDDAYTVISEGANDIESIEVVSAEAQGTVITAQNKGDAVWTVNNMSTDDIDTSKAYSLAGTVSSLTSKNKIEPVSADLNEYGLASPSITVNIKLFNGGEETLYIGDLSPTLGEYFVMKKGDDAVYTMYPYKTTILLQPLDYYMEFNRFSVNIDDIYSIKMIRSDETIILKLVDVIDDNTNNVWEMVSPYRSNANDDYIDNKILEPIQDITLDTLANEEDGGFSSTSPILTMTILPYNNATGEYGESYTETLKIGKSENGTTYVKYKNNTFAVPSEQLSFINESSFNIVSKLQALVDISKVSSVTIEYNGESHKIDITHKEYAYDFKLDGADTDSSTSQKMYQNIIALNVDALYKDEEMGDTVLKITYDGISDADDTVVEFKSIDGISCALVRNGTAEFTIKKSKLTDFMASFDAYVQNPNG
jgi:hypothetical protein